MNDKQIETTQEATPLIYGKIAEVMANISAVSKDRTNAQQKFKFRGIDDVMNTLHGVLAAAGVFIVPNVIHEERSERKSVKSDYNGNQRESVLFYTRLTVRFTFYAADGSNIQSTVIGEAMDSGDKASNKALSIAYKYACLQVFCIPTEDDKDPDAVTHEVRPNNGYNAPNNAAQAPAQNNRVNYQTQQQQPLQSNFAQYSQPAPVAQSFDNMQQVPQPQQTPTQQAADVFAHMTKASALQPQQTQNNNGINQGNLF